MHDAEREACVEWFARNRRRSRQWFELITPDAYYARPIPLRHPLAFYEGHVAAFNANMLLVATLGHAGIDPTYDALFERGIDPHEDTGRDAPRADADGWPRREEVLAYVAAVDAAVREALEHADFARAAHPAARDGSAIHTILEHEAMHHETLLYMVHQLPYALKRRPAGYRLLTGGAPPPPSMVRIPEGFATLGAAPGTLPFGWDNEFASTRARVLPFEIDVYDVTNAQFLAFVDAGGYQRPELWTAEDWSWRARHGVEHPLFWRRADDGWRWRALFDEVPLPPAWPVWVSHAEAAAYARWCGKRLPTEAEYHRAAFGTPEGDERTHPWGDTMPTSEHGNFGVTHWDPVPVGSHPAGASAFGVHDLVGNGWEWTSTLFAPFPGFRAGAIYPGYSQDFFDGEHYVMKGASPATARELVRRSWRNWFRPRYPYVYATFRCVTA
jgi:gamma-glutamyl hercynylcysteine S-oxide synthase